ncbi:hypothetical protein SDC9_45877 [bioreactor metagenome]|uniref:Uncharacterized protein n=1 Tax=bioreactor metagenome TaxID=1076179 RepID=A0A644W7V3_9ZZZZ
MASTYGQYWKQIHHQIEITLKNCVSRIEIRKLRTKTLTHENKDIQKYFRLRSHLFTAAVKLSPASAILSSACCHAETTSKACLTTLNLVTLGQTDHSIVRRTLSGLVLAGGHGTVLFAENQQKQSPKCRTRSRLCGRELQLTILMIF